MDRRKKKILTYGLTGIGLILGGYGLYRIIKGRSVKPVIKGDTTNSQGFDPVTAQGISNKILSMMRANG